MEEKTEGLSKRIEQTRSLLKHSIYSNSSEHGKFKARIAASTTGNVLLRQAQHQGVDCSKTSLAIARYMTAAKLQNARSVVKRASREANTASDRDILNKTAQIHQEGIKNFSNSLY